MLVKLAMVALDAAGKEPPKEFRVLPFGEIATEKGKYLFDATSAQTVMEAFKARGVEKFLDYEHASLADPPPPGGAPAAGWYGLEVRQDGLWATNVRWTPRATEYLKNSEYRYFSPAFRFDTSTRRVKQLVNIALANDPATHGQEPLVAANTTPHAGEPEEKPTMKTLLAKLGLQETSTEAEALERLNTRETKHAELEQELVTLTGAKDLSEARGKLAALKAKADGFDASQAELAELKATQAETEVTALVDGAVREGKITPAQKAFWTEAGKKDLAMLKAFIATAPKIVNGDGKKTEEKRGDEEVATLSAEDKYTAKQLGISEKDFLEKKQARAKA